MARKSTRAEPQTEFHFQTDAYLEGLLPTPDGLAVATAKGLLVLEERDGVLRTTRHHSEVTGSADIDGASVVYRDHGKSTRVARMLEDGQLEAFDVPPPGGLEPGKVAISGDTVALGGAGVIRLFRLEGARLVWLQDLEVPDYVSSHALSGDCLVAAAAAELRVFQRAADGAFALAATLAMVPTHRSLYRCALDIDGDLLAVGLPEDRADGDPVGSWGAVHVFSRTDGVWASADFIKPNQRDFGRALRVAGGRIAVYARTGLFVYAPDGARRFALAQRFEHSTDKFALSAQRLFIHTKTEAVRAAVSFESLCLPNRATDSQGTSGWSQTVGVYEFEATPSPTKRHRKPATASIEGDLSGVLSLAAGTPNHPTWERIVTALKSAWARDAATVEDVWVPKLEVALAQWPVALRSSRGVSAYDFPDVPGWFSLVRVASFSNYGDTETIDAKQAAKVGAATLAPHIEALDLVGCGLSAVQVRALVKGPYLSHLKSLNLSENRIGDAGVVALAMSPQLARLERLELCKGTKIGAKGLRALSDSSSLTALHTLELGFTWGDNADQATVADGAAALMNSAHVRLRRLGLGYCAIGDAGLASIINGANAAHLEALDISVCQITDVGFGALASSGRLQGLRELSIGSNKATSAGLCALLASPLMRQLRLLDVSGTTFDAAIVDALLKLDAPALTTFTATGRWSASDLLRLFEAPFMATIEEVSLWGSGELAPEVARVVASSTLWPRLRVLDLGYGIGRASTALLEASPRLRGVRRSRGIVYGEPTHWS
jgi:hypothetical protein